MSFSFSGSHQAAKKEEQASEEDPLLAPNHYNSNHSNTTDSSGLRSRRTTSKSPPVLKGFGSTQQESSVPMRRPDVENLGATAAEPHDGALLVVGEESYQQGFVAIHDDEGSSARMPGHAGSVTDDDDSGPYSVRSSQKDADLIGMGPTPQYQRPITPEDSRSLDSNSQPPLLEIPEETYAVRKAALRVMKPLTKTWVRYVFSLRKARS